MVKSNIKFLGVCILLGCFLLSVSIVYYAQCNRYYLEANSNPPAVFDKFNGKIYTKESIIDYKTHSKKVFNSEYAEIK